MATCRAKILVKYFGEEFGPNECHLYFPPFALALFFPFFCSKNVISQPVALAPFFTFLLTWRCQRMKVLDNSKYLISYLAENGQNRV